MAATPNSVIKSIPSSITVNSTEVGDITAFNIDGTAESFVLDASSRVFGNDGGTISKEQTVNFTSMDKTANSLRAGTVVTTFTAVLSGTGALSGSLTYSLAGSAKGVIISNDMSDNNGRMQWNISIKLFSSDGSTKPITPTYA